MLAKPVLLIASEQWRVTALKAVWSSAERVIGETFSKLKKMITPDVISTAEPAKREVLRKKEAKFKIKCVLNCLLLDTHLC